MKFIAMLLPINFVNFDQDSERRSIENYLIAELARYFDLKSEMKVEAMALVVEEIDSENCSEEACIKNGEN